MNAPKHIYFDNTRCKVIDWRETQVCFEYMGLQLWRDKTAVSLKKESKKCG